MTTARGQHLIGKVLGSCVLEKLIGYGGSSAVFLAHQHTPDRRVAVKVFLPRPSMEARLQREFYRRFLHEAEVASQFDHPNILPVYAYGEQDGVPYIVMPYMAGGTLSEYVTKHGQLSLAEACWYLEQVAAALDYAHSYGYVHCDVKPANILLDTEGRVMLSDFGIACKQEAPGSTTAKPSEAMMGTPDYISPEQALGQSLDGCSDIYSLGVMLFYLLTKQLPFKADSTIAVALLHVHETPPSLVPLRAEISPIIDRVVLKALSKDRSERFQKASAFSAAFSRSIELTEKLYVASPDGRRALLAAYPELAETELQPLLLPGEPVIRVRPLTNSRPKLNLTHLIAMGTLACMLVLAVVLTTSFVSVHIAPDGAGGVQSNAASVQKAVSDVGDLSATDRLSNTDDWPVSSTFFYDRQQQYHIQNTTANDVALALYADHQFSDFRLTVTMREIHGMHDGGDYYGVVFRSSVDQSHYYVFEVVTSDGGQYSFLRYNGQWKTLAADPAPSLVTNAAQDNTVTVEARGNTFTFFINNKPVGPPITDSSSSALASGGVGLYVEERNAEVAFSHLYITTPK